MAPVCTASQINLLIYHYLKESGFQHACFSLRHEGRLDEEPLAKEAVIEPGQLVKIMQKGLLYLAVEAHVNADGTEKACSAPFSLVGPPHVCDGVARRPSVVTMAEPPSRLTPTPPPEVAPANKVDISVQTQPRSKSQSRASSIAPKTSSAEPQLHVNGNHDRRDSAVSPSSVATSSKTKLDSANTPSTETDNVEIVSGKRKAGSNSGGGGKLAKGDKRIKRTASPQANGTAATTDEENEETETAPASVVPSAKKSKKASNATKAASTATNGGGKGGKAGANAYIPALTGKAKGKEVASNKVAKLKGHSAEVFLSAWNPTVPGLLASGAGDATVRIWDLGSAVQSNNVEEASGTTPAVCKHLPATHAKDVPALSWNPDGTLLASGSYDGILRLWTPQGDLHLVMSMHQGPIFAVRWNRKGNLILSGSADGTAIVWDLGSGKVRQQFSLHSDSVLDIDWLTASMNLKGATPSAAADATLATCSADNSVNILRIGETKPVKILRGHTDEVNALRFDPTGTLLATVSDDMSARIWSVDAVLGPNYVGITLGGESGTASNSRSTTLGKRNSSTPRPQRGTSVDQMEVDDDEDKGDNDNHSNSFDAGNTSLSSNSSSYCKHVLTGHKKDIFSLAWAPHEFGSEEPRLLATASFDNTARIWNADDGSCLRVFKEHTDSVYSVCFSPDRRFLLTGGMDHRLFVSSVATGDVVMAYAGGGGIFDIALPVEGTNRKAIEDGSAAAGSKSKVKEEDSVTTSTTAAASSGDSSSAPRRQHIALSQADRTVTIIDIGAIMDATTAAAT